MDEDGLPELRDVLSTSFAGSVATMFGSNEPTSAYAAAVANGAACRALETDDVHEQGVIHVTATVVPAAIAAAQAANHPVTGRELLGAIALGSDAAVRMSLAACPLDSWEGGGIRGMSTTYQVGTFASALTAARLWRLSYEQVVHAMGYAYSLASGNQQATYDGGLAIRVQQGLSAGSGLTAAQLAAAGLTAARHPLEGAAGYYNLYWRGRYDRSQILDGLGRRLTVADISIKPYPSCKFTHNAITALLELFEDSRPSMADIIEVEIEVPSRENYFTVCEPVERKQSPTDRVGAQFSLPYMVALTLKNGWPTLAGLTEGLRDPEVMDLAKRVRCVLTSPDITELPVPSRVTVRRCGNDAPLVRTVEVSPGHPRAPMTWPALAQKFTGLVSFPSTRLSDESVERLVGLAEKLPGTDDVAVALKPLLRW